MPPLRERRDDIPLLVQHFLDWAQQRHGREPKQVAGAAMRVLCDYSWPGNVRQLQNCMERLVVTVEGPVIHADDLPKEMQRPEADARVDTWPGNILEPPERRGDDPRRGGRRGGEGHDPRGPRPLQPPPRTDRAAARHQRPDPALQDEPLQPAVTSNPPIPATNLLQEPADLQVLAEYVRSHRSPTCKLLQTGAEGTPTAVSGRPDSGI